MAPSSPRVRIQGSSLPVDLLRRRTHARGWNAGDLARESGLSRNLIGRALSGQRISPGAIAKIAKAFAKTPPVDGGLLAAPPLEGS